jgi:hypothetical protein
MGRPAEYAGGPTPGIPNGVRTGTVELMSDGVRRRVLIAFGGLIVLSVLWAGVASIGLYLGWWPFRSGVALGVGGCLVVPGLAAAAAFSGLGVKDMRPGAPDPFGLLRMVRRIGRLGPRWLLLAAGLFVLFVVSISTAAGNAATPDMDGDQYVLYQNHSAVVVDEATWRKAANDNERLFVGLAGAAGVIGAVVLGAGWSRDDSRPAVVWPPANPPGWAPPPDQAVPWPGGSLAAASSVTRSDAALAKVREAGRILIGVDLAGLTWGAVLLIALAYGQRPVSPGVTQGVMELLVVPAIVFAVLAAMLVGLLPRRHGISAPRLARTLHALLHIGRWRLLLAAVAFVGCIVIGAPWSVWDPQPELVDGRYTLNDIGRVTVVDRATYQRAVDAAERHQLGQTGAGGVVALVLIAATIKREQEGTVK